MSLTITIDEIRRMPIVFDFLTFVSYLEEHEIVLTKTAHHIPYQDLAALNVLMTIPQKDVSLQAAQTFYPQLNLFFHLALSAKLFSKKAWQQERYKLQPTKRLQDFRKLNPIEQYFALLETFVVDVSLEELFEVSHFVGPFVVANLISNLAKMEAGKHYPVETFNLGLSLFALGLKPALYILSVIGFCSIQEAVSKHERSQEENDVSIESVSPTSLGIVLACILAKERNIFLWNRHLRNRRDEVFDILPLMLPSMGEDHEMDEIDIVSLIGDDEAVENSVQSPFFTPFCPLLPANALRRTLPPKSQPKTKGAYTFKVAFNPNTWRQIILSSHHTLHDLHRIIAEAFHLEDEHLYAFFMSGKLWTEPAYYSPDAVNAKRKADVKLNLLDLKPTSRFLYLFDFHRILKFDVQLVAMDPDHPPLKIPKVTESQGNFG